MNRSLRAAAYILMAALLAVLVPSPTMSTWTPYGIVLGAAALLAAVLYARQYGREGFAQIDTFDLALVCLPAALVCARLGYCLAWFSYYFLELGPLSVLRMWEGGFLLYGAAAGAMGAAALLAKRRGVCAAAVLDDLAAPGMLVVAVSRLAEWFTTEGVGTWVESEWMMRFPFAVLNEYEEWQLCVFLPEAIAAAVILLIVLRVSRGRGERIMTAVLAYACCQVFFESLRMDGCPKIGFVRISQVTSAVAILAVTMIRAVRAGGVRMAAKRAAVLAVCVGAVGGIEWALDKTPVNNILLYCGMIAACVLLYVNGVRFDGKKA